MNRSEYNLFTQQATRINELEDEIERLKAERDEAVTQVTKRLTQSHELRRALDALELHRIPELEAEIERLNEQIKQHNETCEADCYYRRADATVGKYCEVYTNRGQDCPTCPRQYVLD